MSNTHKGVILEIRETKKISDTFQKREFVVDQVFVGSFGESHNIGVFSLSQEKCALIDPYKVGDKIIVSFDVDYRPWIKDGVHQLDKHGVKSYFSDLRAWKLEPLVENQAAPQEQAAPEVQPEGPGLDNFDLEGDLEPDPPKPF